MRRPPPLTSPHPGSGVYAPSEIQRAPGGGEEGATDGGRSRDARCFSPSVPGAPPPGVLLAPRFPAWPGVSFQRMLEGGGVSEPRPGPGVALTRPASGLVLGSGFEG